MTKLATIKPQSEGFSLSPRNLSEAMEYADLISNTTMVPKDYQGQPGNVLVAIQMGAEIGLPPTQALQNIAVINGRPSVWGDAALALVKAHPEFEDITEACDGVNATCSIKRKGQSVTTRHFCVQDAQTANLWGKTGPWTTYPTRMLQMRARGFAIRDSFPDALKGISIAVLTDLCGSWFQYCLD